MGASANSSKSSKTGRPISRKLRVPPRYCRTDVRLEYQQIARRYVVHGTESGGAIREIGRYVTFAGPEGEPLEQLHPVDSLGVNGVHAVVVASVLVKVDMLGLEGPTNF